MTRLNENEYGPLQPRMFPAARMRAPTFSPRAIASRPCVSGTSAP